MNLEGELQEVLLESGSRPKWEGCRSVLDVQAWGEGAPGSTKAGAKLCIRRHYGVSSELRVFQHRRSCEVKGNGWEDNGLEVVGGGCIKDFFKQKASGDGSGLSQSKGELGRSK